MRILGLIILSSIIWVSACKQQNRSNYFCDAETLTKDKSKFLTDGIEFLGGSGISSLESYKGKYSCLLDENQKYGMGKKIENLIPGEIITVSVYKKTKNNQGYLVISAENPKVFLKRERFSFSGKDKNGWEKITFGIQLPKKLNKNKLSFLTVYVSLFDPEHSLSSENKEQVFFDNLRIERQEQIKDTVINSSSNVIKLKEINIQLGDLDYKRLSEMRDNAIYQGVISKECKKFLNGFLSYNNKTLPIEIRLKGDWIDHVVGKKWSFRIKVKQGQTFNGLKEFSVQSPETRDFLNEWMFHKICEKEDILTTRYNFYTLKINGYNLGVYALEEHFTKHLLEAKERREGPILKFNEEGFWECNIYNKANNEWIQKPVFESSTIMPFKSKKILQTEKLKKQFLIAQNLMLKYKLGEPNPNQYLDINSFAKAYALMSILKTQHSFIWHNQRFYYNPIISRIELIVFDCFEGSGESTYREQMLYGSESWNVKPDFYCMMSVFDDLVFQKKYLFYLKKYSETDYLQNIAKKLNKETRRLERVLQKEYPNYKFDQEQFFRGTKKIKEALVDYEQKIINQEIKYTIKNNQHEDCYPEIPFYHISLNAHLQESKAGESKLSIINYHCSDINLLGYSSVLKPDSLIYFTTPKKIKKYKKDAEDKKVITKLKPEKLFYQTLESDSIFSYKIIMWPRPFLGENSIKKTSPLLNKNSKIYIIEDNKITFLKGQHIVENNIIIPKNMQVEFEAGTKLIFNKNRYLLSYSAVNMIGEKNNPITIKSTDGTGSGLTVLQANHTSKLEYVNFDGLNTFDNNNWTLTGAVTFYESDVEINHCSFSNNHCEDALNIIRSKFRFRNSTIQNTPFDGFDADFCIGIVNNCEFDNTQNDCLDFSGSKIELLNSKIRNVGDKAISCGEKSEITIKEVEIKHANIAIASKDMSEVTVNGVVIENCKTAFASFQKKPEYGPAIINIKNYKIISTKNLSSTDNKSRITFKN